MGKAGIKLHLVAIQNGFFFQHVLILGKKRIDQYNQRHTSDFILIRLMHTPNFTETNTLSASATKNTDELLPAFF